MSLDDNDDTVVPVNKAKERELYLEAALIWLSQAGINGRSELMPIFSALRLGFQLGSHESPETFLPPVAIKAAEDAREKAKEYREQQSRNLAEDNITEMFGIAANARPGFGAYGGGLW